MSKTLFLMLPVFAVTAYAGGGEESEEPVVTEPAPEPEPPPEPNPFTPDGTGTVLDNATDGDGKEFYTITTANENVFYLIIDRQRETENVYFLNVVTEQDLMALAEPSPESVSAIPEPEPTPPPAPEPTPEPVPEPERGGNAGMIIFVVVAVLAAGGAGYYFKVYCPKQLADMGDDYDESEYEEDGNPLWDEADSEDDGPPWDVGEDTAELSGDGEDE